MIYITGDCHADYRRFSTDSFPEQKGMTRDDFVIVCGDFGIWHDTSTERWWLNWLEKKPFTLLFVDGNHENFDRLYSDEFKIVDFHGGKAHKIRENVFHLMRGYVFELEGKKFFAFGGASSHDISDGILDEADFSSHEEFLETVNFYRYKCAYFRINHQSWWKEEMPSQKEMDFGELNLMKNGDEVDFIISHCAPQHVVSIFSFGDFKADELTKYFDRIAEKVRFSKWFFGHYHDNRSILTNYVMLYEQVVRIA